MDTITHGIAGSVLGRTLSERPGARAAMLVGAAAAMLPDLDFLYIGSRLDYLREHRGWTHSFVTMPALALLVALVAKPFARRTRLSVLWAFAMAGVASHILFDWITSFGTMFWTPFSPASFW
jgi:inner membrane protein